MVKPLVLNKITAAILVASCVAPVVSADLTINGTAATPRTVTITLPDGTTTTVANSLAPGTAAEPLLTGNTVTVDATAPNNTVGGSVFGGVGEAGTAATPQNVTGNTVTISGGTIGTAAIPPTPGVDGAPGTPGTPASGGDVFGGFTNVGNAATNTVNISGGTILGSRVAGGWTNSGNAMGNTVNISGGTIGTAATAGDTTVTPPTTATPATGDVFGGWTNAGDASNNTVNVTGGTIRGQVFGGWSGNGNAENNRVTVGATTGALSTVIGGWSARAADGTATGAATNNHVVLNAGAQVSFTGTGTDRNATPGRVVGGWSRGDSSSNSLTIDGATVNISLTPPTPATTTTPALPGDHSTDRISGGYSGTGHATNNTLSITGNSTVSLLFGTTDVTDPAATPISGGWGGLTASQNTLNIGGTSTVTGFMAGGVADGSANGNRVVVTGGTLSSSASSATPNVNLTTLAGGFGNGQLTEQLTTSTVDSNTVDISGTTNITGKVHGGLSFGATTIRNNTLTVNLATTGAGINGDVYGGTFESLADRTDAITGVNVSNNALNLTSGTVIGDAFGGKILSQGVGVSNSTISGNRINLNGANVTGSVFAGYVTHEGTATAGATVSNVNIMNNTVMLNAGTVTRPTTPATPQPFPGSIYGGNITTTGMMISNSMISGNRAIVNGGTIGSANAYAGFAQSGVGISNTTLSGNTAEVRSGTVNGNVYGSFALLTGGTGTGINVTRNTTMINGGSVLQGTAPLPGAVTRPQAPFGVYGGKIINAGTGAVSNSSISDNTVMVGSGATVGAPGAGVNIYGGFYTSRGTSTNVSITNNTVHLADGSTVYGNVRGGFVEAGTPGRDTVNISNNTLVVSGRVGGQIEEITGFDNYDFRLTRAMINGTPILNTTNAVDLAGANISLSSMGGDGPLVQQGQSLELFDNVSGLTPGEMIAVRGITFLDAYNLTVGANGALTATLNQTMLNTQANNVTSGHTSAVINTMAANSFVVDQGLDAFLNSAIQPGQWAPFIAAGVGRNNYNGLRVNNRNSLLGVGTAMALADGMWHIAAFAETGRGSYEARAANVFGAGDTRHSGGGLMTRFSWNNGLYADLTLRAGSSRYNYRSNSFGNLATSYDLRGNYRGAVVTAGMVSDFNSGLVLDSYLQYLSARQDGATAVVAGDTVNFASTSINTGRIGFDLAYEGNQWTPYAQLVLEHTFNSDTRNTTQGIQLNSTDLRGNSVIGGVGVRFNPTQAWSVDANVSGHTGVRDGYQANVGLSYAF